jgi:hypothetical protein
MVLAQRWGDDVRWYGDVVTGRAAAWAVRAVMWRVEVVWAVVERVPLDGVESCAVLSMWRPWPQRPGLVEPATRTMRGAGADDALRNVQECKLLSPNMV